MFLMSREASLIPLFIDTSFKLLITEGVFLMLKAFGISIQAAST